MDGRIYDANNFTGNRISQTKTFIGFLDIERLTSDS